MSTPMWTFMSNMPTSLGHTQGLRRRKPGEWPTKNRAYIRYTPQRDGTRVYVSSDRNWKGVPPFYPVRSTAVGYGAKSIGNDTIVFTGEKPRVRRPPELTRRALIEIVDHVQCVLFWEADSGWNPDKEWDSGTIEAVAEIMERHKLRPTNKPRQEKREAGL